MRRKLQQALELAEGKVHGDMGGRWKVHHHPHSIAGDDIAEKRALALAEGKVRSDEKGRWQIHHHPHSIAGDDAKEKRALELAEGKVRSDEGGRWRIHHHPHAIAGNNEHEKRALAIAEGKLRYHPNPYAHAHARARNSASEEKALRMAEGKESASVRKSIAAGHATAIAKHDDEPVTIQSKWGPLSAARAARQQQLRSIEAREPNMHFDKGVSPSEVNPRNSIH